MRTPKPDGKIVWQGATYSIYVGNMQEMTNGEVPRTTIGGLRNNQHTIYLAEELSAQQAAQTLLHESFHAAIFNGPALSEITGPEGDTYYEAEGVIEAVCMVMREYGVHTKMLKEAFGGDAQWRKIAKQ